MTAPRQGEKTNAGQNYTWESRAHDRSRNRGKTRGKASRGQKGTAAGARGRARTDLRGSNLSRIICREDACYICPSPAGIIPILRLSDLRLPNRGGRWT